MKDIPSKCYNCRQKDAEHMCIYCTKCRLKMAKGEIPSPLMKDERDKLV